MSGATSVAQQWNEELLNAIRIDFPAPTVHARNLFHSSIAMQDAWAAYESNEVKQGDYGRVVAEFWADGPQSETPPGHWNVLANQVGDDPLLDKRFQGTGPVLEDLEWDVKLFLVLNGALHGAAVAAWGVKAHYDCVRPITGIRHLPGIHRHLHRQHPLKQLALLPGDS